MFARQAFAVLTKLLPAEEAAAHCDIPCGIYDPHGAQIAALTVVRMHQLIDDLEKKGVSGPAHDNSMSRYIAAKEDHSELVKKEVRIIWGDYFKPEHVEKFPKLHETVWNVMKLASKTRQEVNMQAAQDLVAEVQKFAEAFWASKGASSKRQPSLQTVGGELVIPVPA